MFLLVFCVLVLGACPPAGAERPAAPEGVEAFDTPSDQGGSITLTWSRSAAVPPSTTYLISIAENPNGPFYPAAEVSASGSLMADEPGLFGHGAHTHKRHFAHVRGYAHPSDPGVQIGLQNHRAYYLRVLAADGGEQGLVSEILEAAPRGNWFNSAKTNNLILAVLFSAIILGYISMARRQELHIRRIAGLEALDEALGRATEMGKPVLFVHGLMPMGHVSTIAAVNILGRVARRTADFDTAIRVANYDAVVMAVSQEVVKESYLEAGRPDAYNDDMVFLAATEQFSYAAAVEGMMVRERPAANIMMGYFFAESLLLAETGASTGAIQIAGTDAYTQLPFFITTCDYTLMGEELYAASAYLSREPRLLGSLKGQDIGKAFLLFALVVGTLSATFGYPWLVHMLTAY